MSIVALLCLLFFAGTEIHKENTSINNFSANVERIIEKERVIEKTVGVLYYTWLDRLHIVTSAPNYQHMVIQHQTMTMYYPLENKAIIVTASQPFELPFISSFLLTTRRDYGLSELGYKMVRYQIIRDTLISEWKPNNENSSLVGDASLQSDKHGIVSVEIRNPEHKTWSRVKFSDFIQTPNGKWIATKLDMEKETPTEKYKESVSLNDVRFNIAFPDSIIRFNVPANATTKEVNW